MKINNCFLCKEKINEKKDKYVHIQDFDRGEKKSDKWCHLNCFNKAMNRELTEMEKKAKVLLNQAQGVFDKIGVTQPVFELK